VTIFEGKATIRVSNRSSDLSSFTSLKKLQENMGNLYGYTMESDIDAYPSWQPNENSELLKIAQQVYTRLYGGENCKATVIHAGLECSWMIDKCGGEMECISMGPTIRNPHTTDESLQTTHQGKPTLVAFFTAVKEIVGAVAKVAKMHSHGTETALY
jgi:dipeptidase D